MKLHHNTQWRRLAASQCSAFTLVEALTLLAILGIVAALVGAAIAYPAIGIFPFGPEKTITAKVERLYVDYSGGKDSSSSHYMVGTDQGVFEVNNSMWLWMWDADERYASMKQGETYRLRVKGKKVLNMLFQEYPGVISVERAQ